QRVRFGGIQRKTTGAILQMEAPSLHNHSGPERITEALNNRRDVAIPVHNREIGGVPVWRYSRLWIAVRLPWIDHSGGARCVRFGNKSLHWRLHHSGISDMLGYIPGSEFVRLDLRVKCIHRCGIYPNMSEI